ncbi:MAG: amino acid permease [Flavobacteriales bacterium]|nr:amino acid permease [Flavobacteriales bacterium]MBP6696700.1 amino acid permease [Flavobacteriales bacterium]
MSGFHRSLGLWDATMLVAGSMIGSGIFIVSAGMLRDLGSPAWMLMAWLVAGILTVLAALSYGELAGMMPKAGGQFVYLQRAYGKLTAFLYGWTAFTVITSGIIAAVAVAFAKFSAVFFPVLSPDNILIDAGFMKVSTAQVYAVAAILLLTLFNTRGVESSKTFTTVFTTAKIVAVLALIVVGLAVGLGTDVLATNFSVGWNAAQLAGDGTLTPLTGAALISMLGVAMVGSLFSSDGWNSITFIAGEVKEPQRNIPRSLVLGTFLVTALYVLANITYLALLPNEGIMHAEADRVGTAAAQMIMGPAAVAVMAGLIMVSTFGCINGYVLVGPRMYYAMAKEGLFFKKAGELSPRGVPQWALWVQCIWACVLCFSGTYGDLLDYATFASLLFYVVTITGLFILRKREPDAERPYRAFGYPLVPALYILCALGFCVNLLVNKPDFTVGSLVIVALGAVVFFATGMHKTEPGKA